MGKVVNVIKASGEVEPFSEYHVISSLLRAGASRELAEKIVSQIKPNLYQNIPTFEIYATVMKILKKEQRKIAEVYNLKKAIMDLGPTGYPFEKFAAAVLEASGYKAEVNKTVVGKCVSHEIDIIAVKEAIKETIKKKKYMVECKFHSTPGVKTDIKVALYTYARFLDIKHRGFDIPWLIANTKLTSEVKTYAACVGMRVTGWDFPEGESLNEMVDKSRLYPVTALVNLSLGEKRSLIDKGIVFCRDWECKIKSS